MIDYSKFDSEFANELRNVLTKKQKIRLARAIASIMERAYRRGVQQALELKEKNDIDTNILEDLHTWRYQKSCSMCFGLNGYKTTSLERLEMEEHNIKLLTMENK